MGITSNLVGRFISGLSDPTVNNNTGLKPTPEQVASNVNATDLMTLGTTPTKENKPRTRQEIYTNLQRMARFAPLSEALNIHVATALGGDSFTNKIVFLKPADRLRKPEDQLSKFEKMQVERLHQRIGKLENLLNQHIFKICHDAVTYGDAYVRVYSKKGEGVVELVCDERTAAPFILPFEVASKTIAYRLLINDNNQAPTTRETLTSFQMLRMKMQRITPINQQSFLNNSASLKSLVEDDLDKIIPTPSDVGGSFLLPVEEVFKNVITLLTGMTSQQVADSVKRNLFAMNQENTTPLQRRHFMIFFQSLLDSMNDYTKDALEGGEAIFKPQIGLLPQMGEKQAITPLGDITGQRIPLNTEALMINVRMLMGGIGLDPSMVGWLDMLTGGLGNGGALSASIQQMLRSQRIRTDAKGFINRLIALDWFYMFGESFTDELDFPWEIEFYSDQTASMTEQTNNLNQRANSGTAIAQLIQLIKDLGLSIDVAVKFLERFASLDYDEALKIAEDIAKQTSEENGEVE